MKQQDEVVQEIPVYQSKDISDSLFLLQYPHMQIKDSEMLMYKGRVKPNTKQLHIAHLLPSGKNNFDETKADDLKYNIPTSDNKSMEDKNNEDFFGSRMENIVTSSTVLQKNPYQDYVVGKLINNSLHLVPLCDIMRMESNFSHLKIKDEHESEDDEEEKEEEAKKVTVHFEKYQSKDASDRSQYFKERSFAYQQKQIDQEDWTSLTVYPFMNRISVSNTKQLICSDKEDVSGQFSMTAAQYLKALCLSHGPQRGSINSRKVRNSLTIKERIPILMKSATLASFDEILEAIEAKQDDLDMVLTALQESCVLVQGIWVINSNLIFPKEESSGCTISNEVLCKVRDYMLFLFTNNLVIKQHQLDSFIKLPSHDMKRIMNSFSEKVEDFTWKFGLPEDNDFITKYPSIIQKQQMVWKSRCEHFNQHSDKINSCTKPATVEIRPKLKRARRKL